MTGGGAEGGPVEGAPQAGRPRHRLGRDARARPGEPGHPAVELRDARAAVAHPAGRLGQPRLHGVERRAGRAGRRAGARRPARGPAGPCGSPGERARRRDRRPSPQSAMRTSWSVTRNGPAPARRTARSASIGLRRPASAACQDAASTAADRAPRSSSVRRSAMDSGVAAEPRRDVGGDRPQVLLAHVLDCRSGRWPTRAGPGGTGECRCAASRAAPGSAATAAPTPTAPRWTDPSAHSEAVPGRGSPTSRSNTPWSTTRPPASGMATWSSVRGIHPGANRGTRSARFAACGASVLRQGGRVPVPAATRRGAPRPAAAAGAQRVERVAERVVDLLAVHQLAEQRVDEAGPDLLRRTGARSLRRAPSAAPSSWRGPRTSGGAWSPRAATTP